MSYQLDALIDVLPDGAVLTDRDTMSPYRQDWAAATEAGWPIAVVRARTTEDVQATVRWAAAHRVPVVPRGAGSGLSGGSAAVDGGIELCTERMRDIVVDPDRPGRDHPTRPAQRGGQARGRRARALVSARPVLVRDVQHRRQRRDQRGAGSAASSTGSPPTTCSACRSCSPTAQRCGSAARA